ncbi:hypothetical protein KAR29_02115 [Aminithiophilus ramosus]|uniref:Heavy-metal chelation domain-containing protein n=2 Tax=Synergistales TaxID=649776 RepID=A0A9Q7EWE9_9BACT|nr:DUF364 domain-containing protein [Aminithiophilus ramosus]QTX32754.1 hypothetical protein KAR29_02115 [Aminithiophilus ramosus]QVL36631.1 hypothetical protein KIH16_02110 [Synergistota bacterium]
MIEEKLWAAAQAAAGDSIVVEVVRGVHFTAVFLGNGAVGVACTFVARGEGEEWSQPLLLHLPLETAELLLLARSPHLGDRSIALATANALLQAEDPPSREELPPLKNETEIVVVGNVGGLVRELKEKGHRLRVFDENDKNSLPLDMAGRRLAEADLVILAANTIINGSWTSLLARARSAWIAGPCCPLVPPLFEGTPVKWLVGRRVTDGEKLGRLLTRGGGLAQLEPCMERVVLPV